MINRLLGILLVIGLWFNTLEAEKSEFWQTITQPIGKIKDTKFLLRQRYRILFEDFKTVDVRYSFESTTKLNNIWDLGLNFTWINARPPNENPFTQRYRWEFELNPHFKLSDNTELRFRNRYEIIKGEHEGRLDQVFRQRQLLVMKVNIGSLKTIAISNEIFFNIRDNRFSQDRLIPLELSFKLGREHTYRLYVMIRWLHPDETWNPQFVLGSTLDW